LQKKKVCGNKKWVICHGDGIIIISLWDELEEVCWKKWKKFCCCTRKRSLWVELEEVVLRIISLWVEVEEEIFLLQRKKVHRKNKWGVVSNG